MAGLEESDLFKDLTTVCLSICYHNRYITYIINKFLTHLQYTRIGSITSVSITLRTILFHVSTRLIKLQKSLHHIHKFIQVLVHYHCYPIQMAWEHYSQSSSQTGLHVDDEAMNCVLVHPADDLLSVMDTMASYQCPKRSQL